MNTPIDPARLDWAKGGGLLPAVVQDSTGDRILMLGYMNEAALRETLARGRVVFYSRSRRRLWMKGETSGSVLELVSVHADCDADAILVRARPAGPVCHLGAASCFADAPLGELAFLAELAALIQARIREAPEGSYTAGLAAGGCNRVAQKLGEEAVELAIAAVTGDTRAVTAEAADLLYHLLVLLRVSDVELTDVVAELRCRH